MVSLFCTVWGFSDGLNIKIVETDKKQIQIHYVNISTFSS